MPTIEEWVWRVAFLREKNIKHARRDANDRGMGVEDLGVELRQCRRGLAAAMPTIEEWVWRLMTARDEAQRPEPRCQRSRNGCGGVFGESGYVVHVDCRDANDRGMGVEVVTVFMIVVAIPIRKEWMWRSANVGSVAIATRRVWMRISTESDPGATGNLGGFDSRGGDSPKQRNATGCAAKPQGTDPGPTPGVHLRRAWSP
jgi:hypothetical protein